MAAAPERGTGAVLIVDDHELVGTSLALSLRSQGLPAHHCDARGGAPGVLAVAAQHPPGLVLLDLDLGRDDAGRRVDGVWLVAPLRVAGWQVVILSGSADHAGIGAGLAEGASAWVPKNAPFPALLAAVRDALAGRPVMPQARREQFIALHRRRAEEQNALRGRLDRLTPREREVLVRLADGQRAQAVADHFVVSLATVRTQIRAVLTKLEVGSQLEAVALYRKAVGR
jgi:DNA-binding NarL/FixJ family response regulator